MPLHSPNHMIRSTLISQHARFLIPVVAEVNFMWTDFEAGFALHKRKPGAALTN